MIDVIFDEKTGDLYTRDGRRMCSLGEILPPEQEELPQRMPDDDLPRTYNGEAGLSETLIKKVTEFELPESKKKIEDALWLMFKGAIHQTMTNTSSAEQQEYASEIVHGSITASMADHEVASEMTIPDYIQLHLWGRNLIARSTTYEGDRLRDATILGRTLNPGMVDALRTEHKSSGSGGGSGGFFGFLKR